MRRCPAGLTVGFPLSLPSGAFRGRVRARTLPRLVGRRWGAEPTVPPAGNLRTAEEELKRAP